MNTFPLKFVLILCLSLLTSCSSDSDSDAPITSGSLNNSDYEVEILKLINEHRKGKGLEALAILDVIKSQTDNHTDYMIAKGKLSHDNFEQRSNYLKEQANTKGMAENVANGYNTADKVVNGWLNSSGHRTNIEGNYTHFNLTAKQNSNGVWYYTNIFIKI